MYTLKSSLINNTFAQQTGVQELQQFSLHQTSYPWDGILNKEVVSEYTIS